MVTYFKKMPLVLALILVAQSGLTGSALNKNRNKAKSDPKTNVSQPEKKKRKKKPQKFSRSQAEKNESQDQENTNDEQDKLPTDDTQNIEYPEYHDEYPNQKKPLTSNNTSKYLKAGIACGAFALVLAGAGYLTIGGGANKLNTSITRWQTDRFFNSMGSTGKYFLNNEHVKRARERDAQELWKLVQSLKTEHVDSESKLKDKIKTNLRDYVSSLNGKAIANVTVSPELITEIQALIDNCDMEKMVHAWILLKIHPMRKLGSQEAVFKLVTPEKTAAIADLKKTNLGKLQIHSVLVPIANKWHMKPKLLDQVIIDALDDTTLSDLQKATDQDKPNIFLKALPKLKDLPGHEKFKILVLLNILGEKSSNFATEALARIMETKEMIKGAWTFIFEDDNYLKSNILELVLKHIGTISDRDKSRVFPNWRIAADPLSTLDQNTPDSREFNQAEKEQLISKLTDTLNRLKLESQERYTWSATAANWLSTLDNNPKGSIRFPTLLMRNWAEKFDRYIKVCSSNNFKSSDDKNTQIEKLKKETIEQYTKIIDNPLYTGKTSCIAEISKSVIGLIQEKTDSSISDKDEAQIKSLLSKLKDPALGSLMRCTASEIPDALLSALIELNHNDPQTIDNHTNAIRSIFSLFSPTSEDIGEMPKSAINYVLNARNSFIAKTMLKHEYPYTKTMTLEAWAKRTKSTWILSLPQDFLKQPINQYFTGTHKALLKLVDNPNFALEVNKKEELKKQIIQTYNEFLAKLRSNISEPSFFTRGRKYSKLPCNFGATTDDKMKQFDKVVELLKTNPVSPKSFADITASIPTEEPDRTQNTENPNQILIIGDLHGRILKKVVAEIRAALVAGKTVVCLGDYVDRGNASINTLTFFLWLQAAFRGQVVLLKGNHECWGGTSDKGVPAELSRSYTGENYSTMRELIKNAFETFLLTLKLTDKNNHNIHFAHSLYMPKTLYAQTVAQSPSQEHLALWTRPKFRQDTNPIIPWSNPNGYGPEVGRAMYIDTVGKADPCGVFVRGHDHGDSGYFVQKVNDSGTVTFGPLDKKKKMDLPDNSLTVVTITSSSDSALGGSSNCLLLQYDAGQTAAGRSLTAVDLSKEEDYAFGGRYQQIPD
ncbi:MAG: Ser/Thr protein phosphatase [Candidatus Improbicoccus devescovinae]|nr:MAG: Ser/Thr protein phosphatase [Candidatus Improbicoccus devescovinae]